MSQVVFLNKIKVRGGFMLFYDVPFGTSDAETELSRTPEIFDSAFYDPRKYIDELVYGDKFVVSGRKGDGKSAYCSKMLRMATQMEELETIQVNLEHLNSKFFDKFTDEDLIGGKRYVPMWKCIILIELIKYFEARGFQIQSDNYCSIVSSLEKIGLLRGDSLETTISKLDSSNLSINIKGWFEYGRKYENEYVLQGANNIYSTLLSELKPIYLDNVKFRMVFDGLDDILRNSEFRIEIVTGLLRAINEINNSFKNKTLDFKAIVLIRSDILDKCRDPDISKIKNGSLINLRWKVVGNPYTSNLVDLVLKRFQMAGFMFENFNSLWKTFFPDKIDGKDSLEYVLENTLYKPRDILMFFTFTKEIMGEDNRKLNEYEVKEILQMYSDDYFLIHMQDELTGFLPDNAINEIQTVISKIGYRRFDFEMFEKEMKQHKEFSNVAAEEVLKLMFERGYIGQYRKRPDHPREEFLFQTHINHKEKYEKDDDCQIHRGLIRALGI